MVSMPHRAGGVPTCVCCKVEREESEEKRCPIQQHKIMSLSVLSCACVVLVSLATGDNSLVRSTDHFQQVASEPRF
jgi:hypothetical protein